MAQSARLAAEAYRTANPHFISKVTRGNNAVMVLFCCFYLNQILNYLCCLIDLSSILQFIDSTFASRHLKENVSILLRNSDGQEWEDSAEIVRVDSHQMKFKKFHIFKNDNYLCREDYCAFELIETNPVVLNVIMFRVNDYEN